MNDLFGTQERQAIALARAKDPETSKDAARKMVESGELSRQEKWTLEQIQNSMLGNFTAFELARGIKDRLYYIIQRRLSGLRDKGKIELTGDRRDGCQVWRLL